MKKTKKILFVCTEDWFFKSHFIPLYHAAVADNKYEAALTCSVGETRQELEAQGIKIWPVDVTRSSAGIISAVQYAWQILKVYRREKPDIIHIFGLKPIMVAGIMAVLFSPAAKMYHVIGLGAIAEGKSRRAGILRQIIFRALAFMINRQNSHIGVENPDDLEYIRNYGSISQTRVTQFGGAGIDTDKLQPLPLSDNSPPIVAFVGRMIWTKGVDVLIEAHQILDSQGIEFQLDLYGSPDTGNPKTIRTDQLEFWDKIKNINWHGQTRDIEAVWRKSDICVVSTRTREGMPRAMLEAAAFGRPLVVTDVPGCRHFVRDGIEGFVAKPDDAGSLATTLGKMIKSPKDQKSMGKAARLRVLDGYTKNGICSKTLEIYRSLLN